MSSQLARMKPSDKRTFYLDEVCRAVEDREEEAEKVEGPLAVETALSITNVELNAAKVKHPELKDVTLVDVLERIVLLTNQKIADDRQKEPELRIPDATAENLWKAAWDYSPRHEPPDPSNLGNLLMMGRFQEPIPLGKLYGRHRLALIPKMGALPGVEAPRSANNEFGYSPSVGGGAIIYTDGHPSEDDVSKGVPEKEERLRTFCSLGWIVIWDTEEAKWKKTGHVLVMDLDDGKQRQPWIVLASEWPAEEDEIEAHPYEANYKIHAEVTVPRNASGAKGVLPENRNRTPIAKIVPLQSSNPTGTPMILRFGRNMNLDLERKSGPRIYRRNDDQGPDLAYVTDWYYDPQNEVEICYNWKGHVYMMFNLRSRTYSFQNFYLADHVQEVGVSGSLVDLADVPEGELFQYETYVRSKKVSLDERLRNVKFSDRKDDPLFRETVARSIAEQRDWRSSVSMRGSQSSEVW